MHGGWQPPRNSGLGPPPGTAPPGYAPPMAVPGAYGAYELNAIESAIVDKTAGRAKLWGLISIVVGVVNMLSSLGAIVNKTLATNLPLGIVGVIVGVTFLGVGASLKNVVLTRGNDLMHMMLAMQKMSTAFLIQILCGSLGLVLGIVTWIILALS